MGKPNHKLAMKKMCVFITGTNCSGKSTLAKELIRSFGGIKESGRLLTFCNDERTCLAGKYDLESGNFGGVDALNQTKILEEIVIEALKSCDTIICEGSCLDSFGINLSNALFSAERQLVVFLYADAYTLQYRLERRSGGALNEKILKKQRMACSSARKWAQIGVPVLPINTAETPQGDALKCVLEAIGKYSL